MEKSGRSDGELLKALASGDHQAFEEFCTQSLPSLRWFLRAECYRFSVSLDLAEDIAHDSLLHAIRWLGEHPTAEVSRSWLRTLAVNKLRDWVKRNRRSRPISEEHLTQLAVTEPVSGNSDEAIAVAQCFKKLSEGDRKILELVVLEGHTPKEAATILNLKEWAAYKRLERALQRLRNLVQESG